MARQLILALITYSNKMGEKEPTLEELMLDDDPEFSRVMECVFGIHEHEIRSYFALVDAPGSTVAELAEDLDRDRSSVNRSLSTLSDKGLIERQRRLLENGGYVYQYFAISLAEMKERMHQGIDEWSSQIHGKIDNFGPEGSQIEDS